MAALPPTAAPAENRQRAYAEWYSWALAHLTPESGRAHAAAQTMIGVFDSGGDQDAAIQAGTAAVANPPPADPSLGPTRHYAQWFAWAQSSLRADAPRAHLAAQAAVQAATAGQPPAAAAQAAQAAVLPPPPGAFALPTPVLPVAGTAPAPVAAAQALPSWLPPGTTINNPTPPPAGAGPAPQTYAPPGFAPAGYAPPGYAPPSYGPPGYGPPGSAPQRITAGSASAGIMWQFGGAALWPMGMGLVAIVVPIFTSFYFPILPIFGVIGSVRAIQRGRLAGGVLGIVLNILGGIMSLVASGLLGH